MLTNSFVWQPLERWKLKGEISVYSRLITLCTCAENAPRRFVFFPSLWCSDNCASTVCDLIICDLRRCHFVPCKRRERKPETRLHFVYHFFLPSKMLVCTCFSPHQRPALPKVLLRKSTQPVCDSIHTLFVSLKAVQSALGNGLSLWPFSPPQLKCDAIRLQRALTESHLALF